MKPSLIPSATIETIADAAPRALGATSWRILNDSRNRVVVGITAALLLCNHAAPAVQAAGSVADQPQLTLSPHYPIKGDLTGFGELGYRWNPEGDYQTYKILWPGLIYSATKWAQLSAGLRTLYTDNESKADTLELRPFAGVKLFLPNEFKWHFFNYTRYEFRDTQNLETHNWSDYHRIRSQFGMDFPLTSREKAWQPRTWYGLADVEPFYRFDTDTIDPVRAGGGIGFIVDARVRVEFTYRAQFSHVSGGNSLQHTANTFRLNIKIGLNRSIVSRLFSPESAD